MSDRIGLGRSVAFVLARARSRRSVPHHWCMTLGDVLHELRIRGYRAIGERLREVRQVYAYDISVCSKCLKKTGEFRYHIDGRQVKRVLRECSMSAREFRARKAA